jgi:hypothetical protein
LRFWDSSALVGLVVDQPATAPAAAWIREDREVAVWTLTQVEMVSALRRLVREDALEEEAAAQAEALGEALLERCHRVTDVERVKALACGLLRTHPLRAGDALQLGAALAWSDGPPSGLVLHTLDRRLAIAAQREGFRVPGGGKLPP